MNLFSQEDSLAETAVWQSHSHCSFTPWQRDKGTAKYSPRNTF